MIDLSQINKLLENSTENPAKIREVLVKAKQAKGLISIKNPELIHELFTAAAQVKNEIYGNRIVLFAPLYISNMCSNECLYCAFRATNKAVNRRVLTQDEITSETKNLVDLGHKRILVVAGESHSDKYLDYVIKAIENIYKVKSSKGEVRRLNANIAPLSIDDFRRLKTANIGTYQLFQETYDPITYKNVHVGGKKMDYDWRLSAIERAIQAGIDDVGIGVLFGLADWRFEILALLQHVNYLNAKFGIGPHTISVPRLEPAIGSEIATNPPHKVSDFDFYKIIAILRLSVPYTGIILSTRESAEIRCKALALGVSQVSAGSKTNPGGYAKDDENAGQFSLGDHRSLDEVVKDITSLNYLPSFCTACYRSERTGKAFMDLAKSGQIKNMCQPNALLTFAEYLIDYAAQDTRNIGEKFITQELSKIPEKQGALLTKMLEKIKTGKRDLYI
jgi:2-iminoacetate synthase